jgi:hypothetical protein
MLPLHASHRSRVLCYQRIDGEQNNAFDRRLCDEDAVKGILL